MSLKRTSLAFTRTPRTMATQQSRRLSNRLDDEDDDSEFGDSDDEELDRGWRCHPKNWIHFVSSHGGLISLLLIYCFIGAYVFMAIESEHEHTERIQLERERKRLLEFLWNTSKELTNENWTYVAGVELNKWEDRLQYAFRTGLGPTTEQVTWDLSGALFFVTTVITTIGYGSIAPNTSAGRVFCIFFAMIGIPLNLLVLTDLGTLMARWGKILSVVIIHHCGNKRKEPKKKSSDEGVVLERLHSEAGINQDVPITVDFNSFTDSGIGENQVITNNTHNIHNIGHHRRSGDYEGYVNINVASDDEGSLGSDQEEKAIARSEIVHERRRGRRTGASDSHPPDEMRRLVLSRASRSHIMADGWPDSPKTRIMSNIPFAREVGNVSALPGDDNDENENNDEDNAENAKESEIAKVSFPVWFCLFLLLSYVAVGALLQSAVENWNFLESFYFCFITLSTIGFGDFVPRKNDETMIGTVIYAVVGLAYTSMCISLASAKLMQFLRLIGTKMNYYKTRQWMKVQAKRRKKKRKRKIATHVIPDISQFNPETFAPVHRNSVSSETNGNGGSGSDTDDDNASHSNSSHRSGSRTSSQHGDDVSRASTISGSSRVQSLHSSPSNASYLERLFYPVDEYTHDSLPQCSDDNAHGLSNYESLYPSYSSDHIQFSASEGLLSMHSDSNLSGSASNKSSQTQDINVVQPIGDVMTVDETAVTNNGTGNSSPVRDEDDENDPDVIYRETVC